ncbi:aminopeptidase [bacterium]|nr:aminopeptidase [bacterium]
MEIRIQAKAGNPSKSAMQCRFYLEGKGGHQGAPKLARGEERAEFISANSAGGLDLSINMSAYREFDPGDVMRVAGGTSVRLARKWGGAELVWWLDGDVQAESFARLLTGALLADYEYLAAKGSPKPATAATRLTIYAGANAAGFKKVAERVQGIDSGVRIARDLANSPANELSPEQLAARAKAICAEHGMGFKILNRAQLEKAGYIGLINVGKGSENPPVMFEMSYKPEKGRKSAAPLCLVGKGITFDTGGISIKPWDGMWDMKADMGGAAAVVGAMAAIAQLKPAIPVTAVVASAENMPDGKAYRPGDVLRYKNGRTVEIHSTDAEGRLVLADALIYAQEELGLSRIVEYSTLTGACARALGHQYIGLMSKAAAFAGQVKQAAQLSGELAWELPLHPEYRTMIRSSVADVRNVGGPLAGAQTAGMFLYEFIKDGTEYVHMDIAGAFLADKAEKYWGCVGATGVGVRLSAELAELLAQDLG